MKALIATVLITGLMAQTASAAGIVCASKKTAEILFTQGQVLFTADIKNATTLVSAQLEVRANDILSSGTPWTQGRVTGEYVRFDLDGSLHCNYRIALPADFVNQRRPVLFLDATCEDGEKSSVQLNCLIK